MNSIKLKSQWDINKKITMIAKMLELDKNKRISASECLKSEFLSILDTKKDMPDLLPSVFTNIYKLNAREKIQQATIRIIVHNIQHNENIEKLRDIFDLLDINKDGQLTYSEIKQAFKRIFPDNYITEEKIDIILEKLDENNDGVISYEEFLRVTINLLYTSLSLKDKSFFRINWQKELMKKFF